MEADTTAPPDDERLARLLAAVIVADLRRFPPAESCAIITDAVKSQAPESAA